MRSCSSARSAKEGPRAAAGGPTGGGAVEAAPVRAGGGGAGKRSRLCVEGGLPATGTLRLAAGS